MRSIQCQDQLCVAFCYTEGGNLEAGVQTYIDVACIQYVPYLCTYLHRKLGARSSSPSGYTMMSSPSQEELHAMQSELRVMRSQSVSIHR